MSELGRKMILPAAAVLAIALSLKSKEETVPHQDLQEPISATSDRTTKIVASIGSSSNSGRIDPTLDRPLREDCVRPDGTPYVEKDDVRYLSQWSSRVNPYPDTYLDMNCGAARFAHLGGSVAKDWVRESLKEGGNEVFVRRDSDIFVNNGSGRTTISVEEPDCTPGCDCTYSADLETFTEEQFQTSMEATAACVLGEGDCDPELVYQTPRMLNVTAEDPEELAAETEDALEKLEK